MHNGWGVGVVIPARNEEDFIEGVLSAIPHCVDQVIVINDGSNDKTPERVESFITDNYSLELINLDGLGVGAAIDTGHRRMLEVCQKPFVNVVMAGDGQMDPEDLVTLINPIIDGKYDHVKGNRFLHHEGTNTMPKLRKIASMILGFLTTLASGRKTQDPQCGYTATSNEVLENWNWKKSWPGYGYPNFWLIQLSCHSYRVGDVPVRTIYGEEKSQLKMIKFFIFVGAMMFIMHHKRCFSMLFSRYITPHALFAFIAYIIGWIALIPGISTDLEREFDSTPIMIIMITTICWTCAHILDRLAVKTRMELKINAKARQKK